MNDKNVLLQKEWEKNVFLKLRYFYQYSLPSCRFESEWADLNAVLQRNA